MHTLQKIIIFTKKIGAIAINNARTMLIATASIPFITNNIFFLSKRNIKKILVFISSLFPLKKLDKQRA